jgi:hypothetical protein
MSTLWIREYVECARDSSGILLPTGKEPAVVDQTVTYTTTTNSNAFNSKTKFIAITSDAAFHYVVQASAGAVAATTAHFRIPANVIVFLGVHPGSKLTVVASA